MRLVQLFGPDTDRLQPLGIRYGNTVYAADISAASMDAALHTLRALLEEADTSLAGLARVTAYVRTAADRDPLYGPWDALFPNPADRPAFKVLLAPLPPDVDVRLDLLALAGGQRRRIDLPGIPARDPTVTVGNWVLTSRVHGTDPASGQVAVGGIDVEARQAFANIANLSAAAEISQLLGFVRDSEGAAALNQAASTSTTAPRLTLLTNFVPPTMHLMLEAIAGTPVVREVFADTQHGPIPDAICIDDLFVAAALGPDGDHGADFESHLRSVLRRLDATLGEAGLGRADVAQVSVYLPSIDLKPTLNQVWTEWFPNSADRPPHKYVPRAMAAGRLVELQVFAIRGQQRRQVLEIPGLVHGDPMSMGVRTGDLVFSSRIVGTDTATGVTPDDPESQARIAFDNVRTLLAQAGATPRDACQINAFITTERDRAAVQAAFQADFTTDTRLQFLTVNLPGTTTVRLEVIASIGAGDA